jgi:hypothetical protein
MQECKENVWTRGRRRTLDSKKERGDKGHYSRGKYWKIDEIPTTKMVLSRKAADPTRKRGRLTKRQRDEVEEDLNKMGLKDGQAMARNRRDWPKI